VGQRSVIERRHRAGGLDHERVVRVRRTTDDLHAARRQLNDEHGVVRHESAPRPHVGREEIRAGNRAPMGPQKRLPGGRPRRHRRNALRFQDPGNRRSPHSMPNVLQGPANASVAPGWVFFGHPRDELPDLLDHAGTSEPLAGIGPLPSDQMSVPPQNRVGRHDRRDLTQRCASKTLSTHREATPLIIRESQTSAAQLGPQDAILLHQIPDHILLTSTEPAGEGREEYLKRGNGNNHGGASLLHRRSSRVGDRSGRVLGHYGVRDLTRVHRVEHRTLPIVRGQQPFDLSTQRRIHVASSFQEMGTVCHRQTDSLIEEIANVSRVRHDGRENKQLGLSAMSILLAASRQPTASRQELKHVPDEITKLLEAWKAGNTAAGEELVAKTLWSAKNAVSPDSRELSPLADPVSRTLQISGRR
jgi:hypothetical protein